MATKSPTQFHNHWGSVADPTELPNVAGAAIQDAAVEAGDTVYSVSNTTTYTCTTPTVGAAAWTAGPTVDHNATTNQTVGIGHTQYVALAGRVGGQTQYGGTAASENAVIESTSHGTKGDIVLRSSTVRMQSAPVLWDLGTSNTNFARKSLHNISLGAMAGWVTVLTIAPSSVAGKYAMGSVRMRLGASKGGAFLSYNDDYWSFAINNAAPVLASMNSISGGAAGMVQLANSGNNILVQVSANDGTTALEGLMSIEIFAPEDYAGGLTYTVS